MITIADVKHIHNKDLCKLVGVSTDTKPTNVPVNTVFFEPDTGVSWYYPGTGYEWTAFGESPIEDIDDVEKANREMAKQIIELYYYEDGVTPILDGLAFEQKVNDNTFLCFKVHRISNGNEIGFEYVYPMAIMPSPHKMHFINNLVAIHQYNFDTHVLS